MSMPQHVRDRIRQQGREWALANPDPVRAAEVGRLLRKLKPRAVEE